MRIVFMGAGKLACAALRSLLEGRAGELAGVVTPPDRPSGRRQHLAPCPVRAFLAGRPVRVVTAEDVNAPPVLAQLREMHPDVVVVADFGQFLKPAVLAVPSKAIINIHPSLLPRYRGAAPIQWAIANGETETGVTILHVTEKMDAGDIILQEKVPIRNDDTALTIEPLLAELGATLLYRALASVREGTARRVPQDESRATFAPKLRKDDGRIDWPQAAEAIRNRVRGFQPWPGSACEVPDGSGHLLKVLRVGIERRSGLPGAILEWGGAGPLIACGEDALRLIEVQPEGKKPMPGASYVNGHKLKTGQMVG